MYSGFLRKNNLYKSKVIRPLLILGLFFIFSLFGLTNLKAKSNTPSLEVIKNPDDLYFTTNEVININPNDYKDCFYWTIYEPYMSISELGWLKNGKKNDDGTYYITITAKNTFSTTKSIKQKIIVGTGKFNDKPIQIIKKPEDVEIYYGDKYPYENVNWNDYFYSETPFKVYNRYNSYCLDKIGSKTVTIEAINRVYVTKLNFNLTILDTNPKISFKDEALTKIILKPRLDENIIIDNILSHITLENSKYDSLNGLTASYQIENLDNLKEIGKHNVSISFKSTTNTCSNVLELTVYVDEAPSINFKNDNITEIEILRSDTKETIQEKLLNIIDINCSPFDRENNNYTYEIKGLDYSLLKEYGSNEFNLWTESSSGLLSNYLKVLFNTINVPILEEKEIFLNLNWDSDFKTVLTNSLRSLVREGDGLSNYDFIYLDYDKNEIEKNELINKYKKIGVYLVKINKIYGNSGYSTETNTIVNVNIENNDIPVISIKPEIKLNLSNNLTNEDLKDLLKYNSIIKDNYTTELLDDHYEIEILNDSEIISKQKITGKYILSFIGITQDGRKTKQTNTIITLIPETTGTTPKEHNKKKDQDETNSSSTNNFENISINDFDNQNIKTNVSGKKTLWGNYKTLFIIGICSFGIIFILAVTILILKIKRYRKRQSK